jgi:RNA polymerase sigma factor (sigma-70 family)
MNNLKPTLSSLYRRHRDDIKRYISQQFRLDIHEIEDIVHVTFVKYFGVSEGVEILNPKAYLYRIARNQAIDVKRESDRSNPVEHRSSISYEEHCGLPVVDDSSIGNPERIVSAKQEFEIIQSELKKMPQKRRNYLHMSRLQNIPNTEIAKNEGISEAAVRKHIARALYDIKTALDLQETESK